METIIMGYLRDNGKENANAVEGSPLCSTILVAMRLGQLLFPKIAFKGDYRGYIGMLRV